MPGPTSIEYSKPSISFARVDVGRTAAHEHVAGVELRLDVRADASIRMRARSATVVSMPVPTLIGTLPRSASSRQDHGARDVLHVDEVHRLLALAVDDGRLAVRSRLTKWLMTDV